MSKKTHGNIMLLVAALIWGTAFVAQRVGAAEVGPFTFNAVRLLIGAAVLFPVSVLFNRKEEQRRFSKMDETVRKKARRVLYLGGALCGVILLIATTLQQAGMVHTTASKAGFITALYIVLVPVFGLFMKKRIPLLAWLGVAVCAVGLYLLCVKENFTIGAGDAMIMLCAVFFTLHIVIIGYFSPKVNGVKLSFLQFLTAGILCTVLMFVLERPILEDILACAVPLLYVGVLSSGIAYTLQILAQRHISETVASLVMSLESVFAVLGGVILLNERLTLKEGIGCVLVFAAVILAQIPREDVRQK